MSSAATGRDDLLLRAVLTSGDTAVAAAREWLDRFGLDDAMPHEQRVLPLLYKKLLEAGCADDVPPLLKGVYRHSWARNVVRARSTVAVIRALEAAGVESLVVKGVALVDHYGDRWGARHMADADLLVHAADAARAIDVLHRAGWVPRAGATATTLQARLIDHRGGWPFTRPKDLELDLHWHLFHTSLGRRADDDVWAAAEDFALYGERVRRPHAGDLVLHACEQGSVEEGDARLACAADVATITRRVGATTIGHRLVEQARRHSLVAGTREFIEMVATHSESEEVVALARQLATARPIRLERMLGAASVRPDSWRTDLLSSARRQAGGRTRLPTVLRGIVRERVEPALTRPSIAGLLYALTGRRGWVARELRRLGAYRVTTPAGLPAEVALGEWIDFSNTALVDRFGGPGWSSTDEIGTWTDGAEARVLLPLATRDDTDLLVTVDLLPYCVAESLERHVEVRVNDHTVARFDFNGLSFVPGPITITAPARHAMTRRGAPVELVFLIRRPVTPATLGLSSDGRRVGLLLRRLRVDVADQEAPSGED